MLTKLYSIVPVLGLFSLFLWSCNGTGEPGPTEKVLHPTPTDAIEVLTQPQPTPTPTPRPTPTIAPTPTMVPTPTPTSTPVPQIRLQQELPRRVWEEFFDNYYSSCSKPAFETLGVVESWSGGQGEREITFTPPSGSYFLVLLTQPEGRLGDSTVPMLQGIGLLILCTCRATFLTKRAILSCGATAVTVSSSRTPLESNPMA